MVKLTEEKNARDEAKAQNKLEKEQAKAERKAAREANKKTVKPKHQAKLDRAREQLPVASDNVLSTLGELTNDLSLSDLEVLSAHLNFHVRQEQTRGAVGTEVTVGQTVRVKSGNVKHLGKIGVVSRAQRIRCYVSIPNVDKEIYLFTSDVEVVENDNDVSSVDDDQPVSVAV